jgi:hypothetical protein
VRHTALEAAEWVSSTVLQICDMVPPGLRDSEVQSVGELFVRVLNKRTQSIQDWVDENGGGTVIFHAYEDLSGDYHFLCLFEFPDEDTAFHFKIRWL